MATFLGRYGERRSRGAAIPGFAARGQSGPPGSTPSLPLGLAQSRATAAALRIAGIDEALQARPSWRVEMSPCEAWPRVPAPSNKFNSPLTGAGIAPPQLPPPRKALRAAGSSLTEQRINDAQAIIDDLAVLQVFAPQFVAAR